MIVLCIFIFFGGGGNKMSDIDVYVLNGEYTERLLHLLEQLRMNKPATVECLLDNGFTNCWGNTFRKVWTLRLSDKYPVSFAMDVIKYRQYLELVRFVLFDELFGQPHPCGKEEYEQIEKIIAKLVDKNILEVYTND